MDPDSPEFVVGFCDNCDELGLLLRSSGLCGDCLPAGAHRLYEEWYNSPAGVAYRNALAVEFFRSFLDVEGAPPGTKVGVSLPARRSRPSPRRRHGRH